MDKQFAKILMLSILLPAGAALGEAMQQERMGFSVSGPGVLTRLEDTVAAVVAKPAPRRLDGVRIVAHHRDPAGVDHRDGGQEGRR